MAKILIVEDSPTQSEGLRLILESAGFEVAAAADGPSALSRLGAARPDLIVSDVVMPGMTGYELCRKVKSGRKTRDIPFILLTSLNDPEDVIEGLECGADNFVTKPYEAEALVGRLKTVLETRRLRAEGKLKAGREVLFFGQRFVITSERRQVLDLLLSTFEDAVRTNRQLQRKHEELETANARIESMARITEEKYRTLMEHAQDAIFVLDAAGRILEVNRRGQDLLARPHSEIVGRPYSDFVPPRSAGWTQEEHLRVVLPDGKERVIDSSASVVQLGDERLVFSIARDVTEKVLLERQFRQAQKMEAVGRLAGGVAHDFNNLLTAILGLSDLSLGELEPSHPARQDLEEIKATALRAARLTQQLLAFSRRQIRAPEVLNLSDLVRSVERMLRRVLTADIELVLEPAAELSSVRADPSQLEQVLLNLVINARDAMPEGGRLAIETGDVALDEEFAAAHPGAQPGEFVLLAVSDTGVGIPEEARAHLFEPFYTTKEPGKGTGLGLATCYGIVKQSGGYISAESEAGRGAVFKIYLPRVDEEPEGRQPSRKAGGPSRGSETILVAEDDASVRRLAVRVLRGQGYAILEAADGGAALDVVRRDSGRRIGLVLADAVMPLLGGKRLAEELHAVRPDLKVLFTSGYTDEAVARHGLLEAGIAFLPKPFTPEALARKVREVLDGR